MEYDILKNLQPYEFFYWFGEICKIPHGTKNEKRLIEYVVEFAKKRSLSYELDKKGNVFMCVPASMGYENQPAILFQAHLDMVCVKEDDVHFDFVKDSIKLKIVGNELRAEGTSLGADNAVGVATMLAIADSSKIKHPKLEMLFTVEEENGMLGIKEFDFSKITARRMINMDCGDSHVLAVSSTGKRCGAISREFHTQETKSNYCSLVLVVDGGIGGHSSISIRDGRLDAALCLSELLSEVMEFSVKLVDFTTSKQSIFKSAKAKIILSLEDKEKVVERLKQTFEGIKSIYERTDPNVNFRVLDADLPKKSLTKNDTQKIVNLLRLIKTAPYREDGLDNSILITFTILSKINLVDGKLDGNFIIRSTNDCDMKSLYNFYYDIARTLGFNIVLTDSMGGWKECDNSPFRNKFIKEHNKLFGSSPAFERVQGGIEIASVLQAIKDMDAVGIAPTARGAHTTDERLYISEVPDYWALITAVLAEKE